MNKALKSLMALMLMSFFALGCTKPGEPINEGDDNSVSDTIVDHSESLYGHDCVDLGLPSGTLWATCNLGADKPEDVGNYYAWGETAPKAMYDWKQYKFSKFDEGEYLITKYCTNADYGYNGYVDSLTVLETADDAVTANWGAGWRMPTREDWIELLSNTTNAMTEQNGVSGRLFTSSNGNTLFLPNTGFYLDDTLICTTLGIYWTSTLQTSFQIIAWSFHSDLDECHVCGTYERSRGQVVRAVYIAR